MQIPDRTFVSLLLAATLAACASAPIPKPGLSAESSAPSAPRAPSADKQRQLDALVDAATKGDRDAQFTLAQAYEVGNGLEKNLDLAFLWYGKAADAGHVPSQFFLGAMYASSRGTQLDLPKALYWYRKAADQGYPDAIYPIAYAYENGLGGLAQSNEQALAWYRKGVDAGNPFAFARLAQAYRLGELGLAIDLEQAALFEGKQKAASGGSQMLSLPASKP